MNRYELEYTMNLSGFGECFDFLGVDATDFSATDESLMMEERVQTFRKSRPARKAYAKKALCETELSKLLGSFHDE